MSASQFVIDLFGPSSQCPVYISSLANADAIGEPGERRVATRDANLIDLFTKKWDRPGRGLFFCTATVKKGASRRAKETIAELIGLHIDIDLKDVTASVEEVEKVLQQVALLPSKVNFSGNGFHGYWVLREALPATSENIEHVEGLLRLLADHLGGDLQCAEVSRLMRLPGTHNSKNGSWIEVRTIADRPAARYEMDELEEWLTTVSPRIQRKAVAGDGAAPCGAHPEANPWLAFADRLGCKPPVDVEERLAAMRYQGVGESSIHRTQLSVTAALLNRGTALEDVVAIVLAATRAAAGDHGTRWNWRREERVVRQMCATWLEKHPQEILPDETTANKDANRTAGTGVDETGEDTSQSADKGETTNDGTTASEGPTETAGINKGAGPTTTVGTTIRVVAGQLPRVVDEAEQALLNTDLPIFMRAGALMYPVTETLPASDGRTTTTVKLTEVPTDLMLDWLARAATFIRFDGRRKGWVKVDPRRQIAATLLVRQDRWRFPRIAGVVTNPVLRPDGSLLTQPGYDPATQLYLALDLSLDLPPIPGQPSYAEAKAALKLLSDLLSGFVFASPTDRAVALSLLLTTVARSALPVAPLHLIRAHTAGTGKSFLVDIAAAVATGRHCPVITAGQTAEEAEKRLGALLREGVPIVSLDNCSRDLDGDFLCQIVERPLVRTRILGLSEVPEFECRATIVATGNNVAPKGDMVRRTVTCNLVANVERPELREFEFDPIAVVLANRGAYLAAAITIVRAYRIAGSPEVCTPIGSYRHWSDMVRAPLIWLDEADPILSMEAARDEDIELTNIRELFFHWQKHLSPGESYTAFEIFETASEQDSDRKYQRPEFRDFLLRIAGDRGAVSSRRLGAWLRKIQGRIVDGLRLVLVPSSATAKAPRLRLEGHEAESRNDRDNAEELTLF